MIQETLNGLIMESMKAHDEVRTLTLRAIKSEYIKWKTEEENIGKEMEEIDEIKILQSMVKQRQDSASIYTKAGRSELAENELKQVNIIKEYLPVASEEDIANAFNQIELEPVKKNMTAFVNKIKEALPTAEGRAVVDYVKSHLS
jgi:uncharacterized protein YqeY